MKFANIPLHQFFFYLLILFFPTQLGLHFWPPWSFVNGLAVDYLSPTIYFTDILIFLIIVFWFLSKPATRNPQPTNLSILFFIFYILFFIFYLNPFAHLLKLFKLLELYLLFVYIKNNLNIKTSNHLTIQPFSYVAIFLSVGILFESLLAIFQFVDQHSLGGIFYFFGERSFTSSTPGIAQAIINGRLILRPYGTFSHPNSLAGYFLASFFLIVFLCQNSNPRSIINKTFFLSFIFYLLSFILLLSFSRFAWLVAGLIFFIIGLLNIKKLFYFFKNFKFLTVIFIFSLLIFNLIFKPIYSRLESITTTDSQSLQKRADLNQLAVKMFLSSPLIGVGLNNFIPNLPRFTESEPQVRFYQPVHNIYLLILAESGLLGFSIFFYVIYLIIKFSYSHIIISSYHHIANYPYLYIFISFISILLTGLFDHYWLTLQQNQLLLTLVLGLIYCQKSPKTI